MTLTKSYGTSEKERKRKTERGRYGWRDREMGREREGEDEEKGGNREKWTQNEMKCPTIAKICASGCPLHTLNVWFDSI